MPGPASQRVSFALSALIGCVSCPADAQDFVARAGWRLELFGDDVAVLQTTLTSPAKSGTGQLLLSCDGSQRRIRLVLAERAHNLPVNVTAGLALIRNPAGERSRSAAMIARFSIGEGRVLSFSSLPGSGPEPAGRLVGLLASRPSRLEIMLHYGDAPITMRRNVSYGLALAFDGRDDAAFKGFATACTRNLSPDQTD